MIKQMKKTLIFKGYFYKIINRQNLLINPTKKKIDYI